MATNAMIDLAPLEVWFVTGSQFLYGPETLQQVEANSRVIAGELAAAHHIPIKVVFKSVLKTPEEIYQICQEANTEKKCIGLIAWMHTFSPAKMWIGGLKILTKPLVHLHTQFNRDIPWADIDMNFMNLNQSAHGDREFGFIMSRMRLQRKVIVGHWRDEYVQERIGVWTRAAAGWHDWQQAKFCRFGDNMRQVAVTEGDKVEAEIKFGYSVNGYGVGDLVKSICEKHGCYATFMPKPFSNMTGMNVGLCEFCEFGCSSRKLVKLTFQELVVMCMCPFMMQAPTKIYF